MALDISAMQVCVAVSRQITSGNEGAGLALELFR